MQTEVEVLVLKLDASSEPKPPEESSDPNEGTASGVDAIALSPHYINPNINSL